MGWPSGPCPDLIRRPERRQAWLVNRVLSTWNNPAAAADICGQPVERTRYRVQVWGPLPGQPDEQDYFVMIVRSWGDRHGWWISPEE
jgi:hypothetical protein